MTGGSSIEEVWVGSAGHLKRYKVVGEDGRLIGGRLFRSRAEAEATQRHFVPAARAMDILVQTMTHWDGITMDEAYEALYSAAQALGWDEEFPPELEVGAKTADRPENASTGSILSGSDEVGHVPVPPETKTPSERAFDPPTEDSPA